MPESARRRFRFIGCEVLYREACHLAATVPDRVDVEFLPKGLHDLPTGQMVEAVQRAVDAAGADRPYDAVLLGYARCNDGLVGVRARDIPVVLPRAHDCITLFLGSREEYRRTFEACPGTYYMTSGWSERSGNGEADQPAGRGAMDRVCLGQPYEQLVARYGRENADYVARVLGGWTENYSRMLYLKMGVCDERGFIDAARQRADRRGWTFELRDGDWSLLRKLFEGRWDEDFVVVPPGGRVVARNDGSILDVEPNGGGD